MTQIFQPVSIADLQLHETIVKNDNSVDNITSTPIIDNKTLEIYTEGS